jgi:hypothetical protein
MHYGPLDRWWIQYILDHGTVERQAGTRNGRLHGNRGRIAPRNIFSRVASASLQTASERLAILIDTELENMLKEKK